MFHTRQIIQSALVAATIVAAAPVHADLSFATGGYARIASEAGATVESRSTTTVAAPAPAFATGGYARLSAEGSATIAEPSPTIVRPAPSFATGGYAREVVTASNGFGTVVLAGDPWRGGVMGEYQGG